MKIFNQDLMNIDTTHARLIFISAAIFFIVSLSHYYAFLILPISQATTLNNLIPPITLMLSHFFIAPLD
jgi:drug/metabolite transporter (DMT)-like permease